MKSYNCLVCIKQVSDTGKVTVITMGLPAATAILREALMCGADKAVLVTNRKAAGSEWKLMSVPAGCLAASGSLALRS